MGRHGQEAAPARATPARQRLFRVHEQTLGALAPTESPQPSPALASYFPSLSPNHTTPHLDVIRVPVVKRLHCRRQQLRLAAQQVRHAGGHQRARHVHLLRRARRVAAQPRRQGGLQKGGALPLLTHSTAAAAARLLQVQGRAAHSHRTHPPAALLAPACRPRRPAPPTAPALGWAWLPAAGRLRGGSPKGGQGK